ncbi:flippase [uncultured Bacteroides sp.]|uniref:flippase n=1 Tax=uncultured Bacteroides sp. TaxID=162156 RepID=UPI0026707917|nr:flippase [uncultured Bacteroides sp.]
MSETSIKKNFAYKSALTISTYLMSFITFPYVSRVLGVDGIGLVSFVDNTINYFLLFATMGINLIGVREIAAVRNDRDKCNQIFSNILGLNLLFTLATLAIYVVCICFIPQFYQYKEMFYIGASKILFTTFLVEWFFTGLENFRYITIRSLLIKALYVIAVFVWVRSHGDYKLYFTLTVGVVVVNAFINMVYVRNFVKLRFRAMFSLNFIKQNLILGIYSIMTSMYLTFNVMYLGFVSDNTEVGYYTTAFKLYSVILGFFTAFTNVMLPRMSALLADGEQEKFRLLVNKSFSMMSIFSIPLILCSMILAPQIIYVLSGSGYEGAILPMRIIMPAVLFVGIAQVLAVQILMPLKKDKVLLCASVLGAFVSIILNLSLVYFWKSIGSAIVLICAEFVVTSCYIGYLKFKSLIQISFGKLLYGLLFAIPCLLIVVLCDHVISNPFLCVTIALAAMLLYFMIIHKILMKQLRL